jgi:hypothetical protein
MANALSNKDLLDTCKQFVVADPVGEGSDMLIKDALIKAELEIRSIDSVPLAWMRTQYDGIFTRVYAAVSSVTQADPGVFDVDSLDSNITGHGFIEDDIVYMDGFAADSMDELNKRFFRVQYIDATTFSLRDMPDTDDLSTASLDAYDSGGYVYHAGILLPASLIEPQTGTADFRWKIGRVYGCTMDSRPLDPISEEETFSDPERWLTVAGSPQRWRYWRHDAYNYADASRQHFLLFYPPCGQAYNIRVHLEKEYPALNTWTGSVGPPHPAEIHARIWPRALAKLAGNAEKMKRQSTDGSRIMGNIEVMYAQHWLRQALEDEAWIRDFSRNLLGSTVSSRGFTA